MDGKARHEFCADLRTDAVESLQGARDELGLGEVDAEDENLDFVRDVIYANVVLYLPLWRLLCDENE